MEGSGWGGCSAERPGSTDGGAGAAAVAARSGSGTSDRNETTGLEFGLNK
jgi:hypothetical protein